MGRPGMRRRVGISMRELFAQGDLLAVLSETYSRACGMSWTPRSLAIMGRGHEQHARLFGSPVGATIVHLDALFELSTSRAA